MTVLLDRRDGTVVVLRCEADAADPPFEEVHEHHSLPFSRRGSCRTYGAGFDLAADGFFVGFPGGGDLPRGGSLLVSIIFDIGVQARPETVGHALSNVGDAHRMLGNVLCDCRLESDDIRLVISANGLVVRERIISVGAALLRIACTVISGGFEHHGASRRVIAGDSDTCRFEWICDGLPDPAGATGFVHHGRGHRRVEPNFEQRQHVFEHVTNSITTRLDRAGW